MYEDVEVPKLVGIKKLPLGSAQILQTNYSIGGLMTQAQILQSQVMGEFFSRLINPWSIYTDKELMKLYHTAIDTQDSKNIAAIRKEMNRGSAEL